MLVHLQNIDEWIPSDLYSSEIWALIFGRGYSSALKCYLQNWMRPARSLDSSNSLKSQYNENIFWFLCSICEITILEEWHRCDLLKSKIWSGHLTNWRRYLNNIENGMTSIEQSLIMKLCSKLLISIQTLSIQKDFCISQSFPDQISWTQIVWVGKVLELLIGCFISPKSFHINSNNTVSIYFTCFQSTS